MDGVNCMIAKGDAAAEIIDVARKSEDNLVAMCSHGRSGISRWVLGGTADRVVRHSQDPVLVIRASE
jgi:nucleotide-binding universal stress UspA family protein